MKCNAMLFDLITKPNKANTGTNNTLIFIDEDTGESFRTFVDPLIAAQYAKYKHVEISLSLSLGEYNGKAQLNTRILSMSPVQEAENQTLKRVS
jgi:hypothetical protein